MNLIIDRLYEDHSQMMKILLHLGNEIRSFTLPRMDGFASDRILDILDYIKVYPEIWHHPVEDLLYSRLLEKNIPEKSELIKVIQQHEFLEQGTADINELFNQIGAGETVSAAELIKTSHDYIQQQLAHMKVEQEKIFPLIEEYFDRNDWESVKKQIKGLKTSEAVHDEALDEYNTLREKIVSPFASVVH